MKLLYFILCAILGFLTSAANAASLLEHQEIETGAKLPGYTGNISSPFSGIVAYANGDGVDIATSKLSNAPGIFRLDIRGASSNTTSASISIYIGNTKISAVSFSGTSASTQSIQFQLESVPVTQKFRFMLENDTGANDTFLDWYDLYYVGQIPPPPAPPILPTKGAFQTGVYRNLFTEMGYTQADVDAKVTAAYNQLFHSSQTDRLTGQSILINDPTDSSRAYIWDAHNNDVRSEGLSYGMMLAVQMNRQDDFNKIWAWANKYSLNTSGEMKGYFGWKKNINGSNLDANPAPDGEEYFVTALFFASNRWGDGAGIYNYKAEANKLLDNMYENGQTHYVNGVPVSFSLFDKTANQILFSPYGAAFTDPSYHLPAFYELWSRWANNNRSYWAQLALNSRALWKKAIKPNGLNPDYSNFDGSVVTSESKDHQVFYYDAMRTVGNAGLDFAWFLGDSWEITYAKSLHSFLKSKGNNYPSLYNLDGTAYNNNADHSPGFIGMNSIAALASDSSDAWFFVKDLWNTPVPSGEYRYYDGNLYMFGLLATSGKYKIYCPGGVVCNSSNSSSSSSTASSKSSSSQSSNNSNLIKIEAENSYATSDVQNEPTSDIGGGLNVGWIDSWDWMAYHINVPAAGDYKVSYRVASMNGGGVLKLEKAGGGVTYGTLNVQATGGWQNWITLSHIVNLPAGQQDIGIVASVGGFNLNWFQIEPANSNSTIVIRARGTSGQEKINFKVNNTFVQTFSLSTTMSNYTVNTNLSGGTLVEYFNDASGSDVQVDYISINGVIRQSENQSYNTGVWQNNACGGGSGLSEWLHCNGAIGYGNL